MATKTDKIESTQSTSVKEELTLEALAEKYAALEEETKKLREIAGERDEPSGTLSVTNLDGQPKKKIRLFRDSGKYADDVFVGVNGQTFLIQRGMEVEVPEAVAEVLENAAAQDQEAASYMMGLQNQYEQNKQPGT